MRRCYGGIGVVCCLAIGAGHAEAGVVSVPAGSGVSVAFFEAHVGLTRNRSVGQTFKVPDPEGENFLSRLSMAATILDTEGSALDYSMLLYEFDPTTKMVVGDALFDSGPQQLTTSEPVEDFTLDFFPGIFLDADKKYIAFLTTQGLANDSDTSARVLQTRGSTYADGEFVVQFGPGTTPMFETDPWQVDFSGDLAGFEAVFLVPGPAAAVLGVFGLGAVACTRRRSG